MKSILSRGYSIKEMISELLLSYWTHRGYLLFLNLVDINDEKSIYIVVSEVLQEVFRALNIKMSPDDIEGLFKDGYDTAIKLEK